MAHSIVDKRVEWQVKVCDLSLTRAIGPPECQSAVQITLPLLL